jgi:hypothetical protein
MTEEDEEFQRIEREAAIRLEAVVATVSSQRTWVGLTDDEWESMYDKFAKYQEYGAFVSGWDEFARAIEAKLKEKNT